MLGDKLVFLGPKENVAQYLQASDIFVLNSKIEGIPNSLLEAMACGLAICTRVFDGLPTEIIQDGINACVYSKAEVCKENLQDLILDRDLRDKLGQEASGVISERFSYDKVFNRLADKLKI